MKSSHTVDMDDIHSKIVPEMTKIVNMTPGDKPMYMHTCITD